MKDFEKDRIFFASGNLIKVHIGIVNFIITVEMVEHLTDTCAQNGITKPYNLWSQCKMFEQKLTKKNQQWNSMLYIVTKSPVKDSVAWKVSTNFQPIRKWMWNFEII